MLVVLYLLGNLNFSNSGKLDTGIETASGMLVERRYQACGTVNRAGPWSLSSSVLDGSRTVSVWVSAQMIPCG